MREATKKEINDALTAGVIYDYGVLKVEFLETNNNLLTKEEKNV